MAGKVRNFLDRDGTFYARLVVQPRLRKAVGKTELRTSLGRDRRTALKMLPRALTELQDRITAAEQATGSHVAPNRLVGLPSLAKMLFAFEEAQDHADRARTPEDTMNDDRTLADITRPALITALKRTASGRAGNDEMAQSIGWSIDWLRERGNADVETGSSEWRELAMALAQVQLESLERSNIRDRAEVPPEPKHPLLATPKEPDPVPFETIRAGYYKSIQGKFGADVNHGTGNAEKATKAFSTLKAFLKHDDAAKVTDTDLDRWTDHLKETLEHSTIKHGYHGPVKACFRWAARRKLIAGNPAEQLVIDVGRKQKTRDPGYSDREAIAILKACVDYKPTPDTALYVANARRWAMTLMAYTGARIGSIISLQKQDVRQNDDGLWFVNLAPHKGGHYREVPLHSAVVESGFLDFISSAKPGFLFCDPDNASDLASARHSVARHLASWLQDQRLVPAGLQPTHAMRHRLKSLRSRFKLDGRTVEVIQGHTSNKASDGYGTVTLADMAHELEKLPALKWA